jgi:cation diffusion facilitator family transporter
MKISILRKISRIFKRNSQVFYTRISLILCTFLAIGGIVLGAKEDSLTILTNGLISAVDIITSLLFLIAINQTVKNPDITFNYGYGKYESLAILTTALLTMVLIMFTLYQIINDFGSRTVLGNNLLLIIFSTISCISMFQMSKLLKKASQRFHIPLLKYDSDLWKADFYIEFGVIVSLIVAMILGKLHLIKYANYIDSSFALILLAYALKTPIKHGKDALFQLLDRTLPENIQFELLSVVVENINRFCEFKRIHTRQSGKDIFIELDVIMPYDFTLEEVNKLEKDMERAFKKIYPTSLPRIYSTPCIRDCHHNNKVNCPVKIELSKKFEL